VVWDGEDDRGKRVTGSFTARVSLGLKARLERTLFWAPHKRAPLLNRNIPPLEGMAWMVPDVGISGNKATSSSSNCICASESRFDLDLYSRSFCSEVHKYRVCVVDSNGNPMLNIGRMGNVDDGLPLAKNNRVPNPRKIGGDEVAIAHCTHVAVHSDKRLSISDVGNTCIRSVKLDYHASESVPLR
jgi:hypothetical protein